MISKIERIGIRPGLDEVTAGKIKISNQLWFILLLFNTIVSLLFLVYAPNLLIISLLMLLASGLGFLLNYVGAFEASRFLGAIAPFTISEIGSAAISQSPTDLYIGNGFIAFSFLVIPFIIYDLSQKVKLLFAFAYCIMVFFIFPDLNDWIQIPIDNTYYGSYQNLVALMAIVILVSCLYVLQYINKLTKDKNQMLLSRMEENNGEIEKARIELLKTLEAVEKTKKEDHMRAWASDGLAHLTTLSRQYSGSTDQYYNILSWLAKYLQVNQAALYILEDENAHDLHLKQAATYAFERRKFIERRLEVDKGLVGACFQEKKKIILSKVPDNYLAITSGLGGARPRFVILLPLVINEEVTGVIELADFRVLEDYEIAYLEKVSENIAALVRDHKIKIKTQNLIEEANMQSEMMKAQEEEMRQNMEELMATQEESERKTKEMQEIINTLRNQITG